MPGLGVLAPAAAVAAVAAGVGACAAPLASQVTPDAISRLPVDTFRTANGLRVVVSEDRSAPVVAVSVWYRVGRADDPEGGRGLAWLTHRVAGRGPERPGSGPRDRLVARAGGHQEVHLGPGRTAFSAVVPSHRVNQVLWLQARTMARLRLTETALQAWRRVAEEERRALAETRPFGPARIALDTLAHDPGPYRRAAVGPPVDLEGLDPGDVEAFHSRFYVPSNAVLSVVGDVDIAGVRAMVERYFGGIAAGRPAPDLPEPPPAPRSGGERRLELVDPLAPSAGIWIAYTVPAADHPDRHAVELLQTVLGPGVGSRLGRRLQQAEEAAVELAGLVDAGVGPGTLRLMAVAAPGVEADHVEALIAEEIERLRRGGVTRMELERAVNRRRSQLVGQLLTVRGRVEALQWHAWHEGSPYALHGEMARYEAVSPADVERVARTYLVAGNRAVVVARPASPGEERE